MPHPSGMLCHHSIVFLLQEKKNMETLRAEHLPYAWYLSLYSCRPKLPPGLSCWTDWTSQEQAEGWSCPLWRYWLSLINIKHFLCDFVPVSYCTTHGNTMNIENILVICILCLLRTSGKCIRSFHALRPKSMNLCEEIISFSSLNVFFKIFRGFEVNSQVYSLPLGECLE